MVNRISRKRVNRVLNGLGKAARSLAAQSELCRNGRLGGLAARAAVLCLAALAVSGCMRRSVDTAELSADLTLQPAAVSSDQTASPALAEGQLAVAIKTPEASSKDLRLPPHLQRSRKPHNLAAIGPHLPRCWPFLL